jgi:hypothetical protein
MRRFAEEVVRDATRDGEVKELAAVEALPAFTCHGR